jgi:hypothetical protein
LLAANGVNDAGLPDVLIEAAKRAGDGCADGNPSCLSGHD